MFSNSQQVNELLCASLINPKHKYVHGPLTPPTTKEWCSAAISHVLVEHVQLQSSGEDEITSLLSFRKVSHRSVPQIFASSSYGA